MAEKKWEDLTPEEKVDRYYGVTLGEPTAEDEERWKMAQRLWLERQQGEKTDRYPLCFRDWKIFGKRYLDELTPDELAEWNELHRGELGVSADSNRCQEVL